MKTKLRLSASGAAAWTNCSQSVVLPMQNQHDFVKPPEIAERGTLLHAAAAKLLSPKPPKQNELNLSADDLSAVLFYVDHINDFRKENRGKEFIETKFTLSMSGVDIVAIPDYALIGAKKLTIIDLKTGYTSVPADNLQNKIYAHILAEQYNVHEAELRTVMPALRRVNFANIPIDRNYLKNLIANFKQRLDEFHSGAHCRYCNAITYCPEFAKKIKHLTEPKNREKILRSPAEFAEWWKYKRAIEKFYETLEAEIFTLFDLGQKVDGLEIAEASGRRVWAEGVTPKQIARALKVKESDVVEKRLLSPPQIEKKFGLNERLNEFIVRPKSRTITLSLEKNSFE